MNWGAKAGFSQKRTKRTGRKISDGKATVDILIVKGREKWKVEQNCVSKLENAVFKNSRGSGLGGGKF